MTVIVDVNILFSALISPNSTVAKLLIDPTLPIQRFSCHYAVVELFKHQSKIVKYAKKPVDDVIEDLYTIINNLHFYNESLIEHRHWREADRLTSGVDSDDIAYVALALQKEGWLWTGDKKLTAHLRKMGFEHVVNTNDLYDILKIR